MKLILPKRTLCRNDLLMTAMNFLSKSVLRIVVLSMLASWFTCAMEKNKEVDESGFHAGKKDAEALVGEGKRRLSVFLRLDSQGNSTEECGVDGNHTPELNACNGEFPFSFPNNDESYQKIDEVFFMTCQETEQSRNVEMENKVSVFSTEECGVDGSHTPELNACKGEFSFSFSNEPDQGLDDDLFMGYCAQSHEKSHRTPLGYINKGLQSMRTKNDLPYRPRIL